MIDISLDDDKPILVDDIDLLIQQIDLLFDTNKKELLGNPDYGTDYDEFLFNLTMSNAAIEYQVRCDLSQLNLFGFEPTVRATILEGTLNDIILLQIGLKRDDEYYEKTYKLQ